MPTEIERQRLETESRRAGQRDAEKLVQSTLPISQNPDFSVLCNQDEYGAYFNLLKTAFKVLLNWSKKSEADVEHRAITDAAKRLLNTAEALQLKYTFDPQHFLKVDLSESGYPNRLEMDAMQADFSAQSDLLASLASPAALKNRLLDHVFKYQEDAPNILQLLGERTYLDSLLPDSIFFPFTPGELVRQKVDGDFRYYAFTWYIFDFSTNLPYVYLMTFTQDASSEALEDMGEAWNKFLLVIANDGSRAPAMNLLASAIDEQLIDIHPKIFKRICLGPLYAGFLMDNFHDKADPYHQAFENLIAENGLPNDFVLLLTDEIVISAGEQKVGTIFNRRIRQTFYIPEDQLECYSRGVSKIHQYAFLPHRLWQAASKNAELIQLGFNNFNPITFNEEGAVNG